MSLLLALLLGSGPRLPAPPPFWGTLEPGSYGVGFRTLHARDATRRFAAADSDRGPDAGRPIRANVWYPASVPARTPAMHYGDYFHDDGPPDWRRLNDILEERDRRSWIDDLAELTPDGKEWARRLFAVPVAARRNAPAASGRFPVLLYAGGRRSRLDANVELGEYLASHGYVVVTVPQLGPSEAELELGSTPDDIRMLVEDLALAWRLVKELPIADPNRLAVAGHSAGGVAALQLAMNDSSVKAVVGLDGSYGLRRSDSANVPHRPPSASFPDFEPDRLTVPLLDLHRAAGVQDVVLDSSTVDAFRASDRYVAVIPRMYHGDFTEFAPIAYVLEIPWPTKSDGRTRRTGSDGNQHVYRAALDFLEAELRGGPDRLREMSEEIRKVLGATLAHHPPEPLP